MLWVFAIGAAVLVTVIGLVAVGSAVARTEGMLAPAVLDVHDAVDWIAERLPDEAAALLTYDDVVRVVGWWLEYVGSVGLASEHGQELGGGAAGGAAGGAPAEQAPAEQDAAVDHVVARALEFPEQDGGPLDAVSVVVVLDLLVVYLTEVGAIGGQVGDGGPGEPRETGDGLQQEPREPGG